MNATQIKNQRSQALTNETRGKFLTTLPNWKTIIFAFLGQKSEAFGGSMQLGCNKILCQHKMLDFFADKILEFLRKLPKIWKKHF